MGSRDKVNSEQGRWEPCMTIMRHRPGVTGQHGGSDTQMMSEKSRRNSAALRTHVLKTSKDTETDLG